MTNYTNDPKSACCGDPGDCNKAHLYCFNRLPKEADVTAMQKFEQDKIETPEQRKAFDVAFEAARASIPAGVMLDDEVIRKAQQAATQAIINGATHGSTPAWALPLGDAEKATAALDELVEQAQELDMGYCPPAWALGVLSDAEKAIEKQELHLPTNSKARKDTPICTGVLDYFPKALAAVARLSKAGNDKHNPGQPLHWAREKSTDHADCIIRHMLERGTVDEFGFLHEISVAWRALAQLEVALEKEGGG